MNGIVVLLGLVGNAIALLVFSRRKFAPTIFHVYFRVLIVFDSIVLLAAARSNLGADSFVVAYLERLDVLCLLVQCTHFAERISSPISGYILAAVALDRLVSITRCPRRRSFFSKKAFQLAASMLIVALNIFVYVLTNSPSVALKSDADVYDFHIDYELNATNTQQSAGPLCVFQEADDAMQQLEFVNSSVVPFALMFVFTLATLVKVFVSRRKANARVVKRDVRFVFVSIGFNLTFLTLTFPYTMRNLPALRHEHVVYEIFNFMNLLNFGLTFFLSLLFNRIFASELAIIIGLKQKHSKQTRTLLN